MGGEDLEAISRGVGDVEYDDEDEDDEGNRGAINSERCPIDSSFTPVSSSDTLSESSSKSSSYDSNSSITAKTGATLSVVSTPAELWNATNAFRTRTRTEMPPFPLDRNDLVGIFSAWTRPLLMVSWFAV